MKKFRNQNLKVLNYKYLLTGRKYFNNNQISTRPKDNICLLPLCDLSNLIFSTIFEEDIECNCIISHMCKPKIFLPNLAYFRLITIHL